jgi:4-deoxy-L-threo-5-hexosulose-uronate ketol-isomerase
MSIKTYYSVSAEQFERMNTKEIRDTFLVDTLFIPEEVELCYSEVDRAIIGSTVPAEGTLRLEMPSELSSAYFLQMREIGIINIGNKGTIEVDGKIYEINNRDILYIGRGNKDICFSSVDKKNPAKYYLVSYPAHKDYPISLAKKSDAEAVRVGSKEKSNKRTIYKYIHPKGIKSCQLVMGFTELAEGSVWNTMPAHTHFRRSEIYMYFDIDENNVVFHLMGKPGEVRTVVMRNGQVVISPIWSIHSGVGTKNYTFVWAMGGENQEFDDMDSIPMEELK